MNIDKSISFLLLAILTLLSLLFLQGIFNHPGAISNADILQYPAFSLDLFKHHYSLLGWNLFETPNFFLTIFFYAPIYYLTGSSSLTFFIMELLEILILILLLMGINNKIYSHHYRITIIPLLLVTTFVLITDYNSSWVLYDITTHCHFLTVLISLASFYILFNFWYQNNSKIKYLLFFIGLLITISDQLILPMFFAPSLLSAIICYRQGIHVPKKILLFFTAGAFSAFIFNKFVYYHQRTFNFSFQDFSVFKASLPLFFSGFYLLYMSVWLSCFLAIIFLTFLFLKKKSKIKSLVLQTGDNNLIHFWIYYLFFLPFLLLFSTLALGQYGGILSSRYLTAGLLFPIYGIFSLIFAILGSHLKKIYTLCITFFLTCGLLLTVFFQSSLLTDSGWKNYYPAETNCVDHFSDQFTTAYGLANYWNSRLINSYSQRNLWINQITASGLVYWWVNNKYWYLKNREDNQLPTYSFIILDKKLNQSRLIHLFGKPDLAINCWEAGYQTKNLIYIYKKPTSIGFLNNQFYQLNKSFFKKELKLTVK